MTVNDDFRFLSIGLPDDIERRKQHGDFEGAIRLIDKRLSTDIPEALKSCMRVEREIMKRIVRDYPYTLEDALRIVRADIPDFTQEEFAEMVDDKKIDWIYVDGVEHYFDRFRETLMKVDADYKARARAYSSKEEAADDKSLLESNIADMKRDGSVSYRLHIRATLRIKDEYFRPGARVKVHLPLPAAARQTKDIDIIKTEPEAAFIAPEYAFQRTAYFDTVMSENREFSVEYAYTNTLHYIDAYSLTGGDETQPDFFTCEQPPHIMFTPYIKELVETLTQGVKDPMEKARIFYDFITKNVRYSYMREYFGLKSIAESCARNFRGDCGVQALLFITLCRCAGIPAKWQSGLSAQPDDVGAHDWAEFYVAPFGWMFADPSFGGGAHRAGAEDRRRFYFGNLDPYRMVANSRFQTAFVPDKDHWRADPYDNQTGEVEYADYGLTYDKYERDQVMVKCEKL